MNHFNAQLSLIFEEPFGNFPKLRKFLLENGFEFQNDKYVFQKEVEKVLNMHQSLGIEVLTIGGKIRINYYHESYLQDLQKPIEAENENSAIEIVRNLLEKFFK